MRRLLRTVMGFSALVIILAAGCGRPADTRTAGEPAASSAPSGAGGAKTAHFEAAAYEVQVPAARAAELDGRALAAKAATAEDLRKALADFGPTKVLYKVDQPVNLHSENIRVGSREPFVTNSRMTESGAIINTVQYQQVGLIINMRAGQPPKDSKRKGLDVQMKIELSALCDSGLEIGPKTKAVIIRSVSIDHSEPLQYGRPFIMLSVSYPSKDEKASPVAYVVRGVFSEVQP
ncbi:MAG: hypothetical protein IMZ44_00970 [Planctomycetes bacterium]|nr:hypothetical protein [Planctomycetota bacterium]